MTSWFPSWLRHTATKPGHELERRPHDRSNLPAAPPIFSSIGQNPAGSDEAFDVFFSYTSSQAHLVRPVAEQLLAAGVKVWFDEYVIRLWDRAKFRAAIEKGTATARYGVIFVDAFYFDSKHCQDELRDLITSPRCGLSQLIQIILPGGRRHDDRFPELDGANSVSPASTVEEVLTMLSAALPFGPLIKHVRESTTMAPREFSVPKTGHLFRINLEGWRESRHSRVWLPFVGRNALCVERDVGETKLNCNLLTGSVGNLRRIPASSIRDRWQIEYRDSVLGFASSYFQHPEDFLGVHLVRIGQDGHLALSYRQGAVWMRKYSLDFSDPVTGEVIEFAFTCSLTGTAETFLSNAHRFDALVTSCIWGPNAGIEPLSSPEIQSGLSCEFPDGWKRWRCDMTADRLRLLFRPNFPRPDPADSQLNVLITETNGIEARGSAMETLRESTYHSLRKRRAKILPGDERSERVLMRGLGECLAHEVYYSTPDRTGYCYHFMFSGFEIVFDWSSSSLQIFELRLPEVLQIAQSCTKDQVE